MSNRRFVWVAKGIVVFIVCALGTPRAFAQAGDKDTGEISALGGIAFGGSSPGIGAKASVTGGAGLAFSKYAMVMVETSFMPLGQHTIQGWPAAATVDRSYLFDFGVDFHIRIPVKQRWGPYAIAGTGLLWDLVRQDTVTAAGTPLVRHYNQFNGALHTGGGLRYYITENWGIRPEVKVIVSKQVYTSVSVGVFYVVPSNWP